MKYVTRLLEKQLITTAKHFPSLIVTGPRRAGKTSLLRHAFPNASYYLLEDPDIIDRIKSDPHTFLDNISLPVILDEIQNTPELFNYIRSRIDQFPQKKGQWLLTGSQEAPLMQGVSESMAGRAAIFQLLPFSTEEFPKVNFFHGGFPEVLSNPLGAEIWFRSYIQTYLERDVRSISAIKNLSVFRRFLSILASRTGQILNKTELASPLGVSIPTITEWLNILEITGQILLVPPFYENFGKRLIKSPKLYFMDSGLICYLLGIDSLLRLMKSPFLGSIFEGFLASEIVKFQYCHGKRKEIYYFRDRQGLEIDFLIPKGDGNLLLLEAKATRTPKPDMAQSLKRLSQAIKNYTISSHVVTLAGASTSEYPPILTEGVGVVSIDKVHSLLMKKGHKRCQSPSSK